MSAESCSTSVRRDEALTANNFLNLHNVITRHCHANNLPSTEQAVKTQPKQDKYFSFIFHRF